MTTTEDRPDIRTAPWLDEREQAAWRAFVRMQAVVDSALRRQLQRSGELSLADYEVLVCLSESETGELRSFQIADALQWEASRISHQLRRMDDRGLLERRNCPEDRRGVTVVLTAAGRKAIEAAAPLHVAEVRRVFIDRLSPTQLDDLAAIGTAVVAESDTHSDD